MPKFLKSATIYFADEIRVAIFCGVISFILLLIVGQLSTSTYDTGDSVTHFLYSKYSWQKLYFFVHAWAKPVFTFLSSPFSQFGFTGMKFFQAIVWAIAVFFTVASASKLKMKHPWLTAVFMLSMKELVLSAASGLTEPLFAMWLMAGVYFFVSGKNVAAAIFFSFLLYVRSEGQLVMIAVVVYMLVTRKWKFMPFLLTSLIVYGLWGLYWGANFFWYFTNNPYNHPQGFYGYGKWDDYINDLFAFIGPVLFRLAEAGLISFFFLCIRQSFFSKKDPFFSEKFFLVYGIAAGYFVAQTIFWWKGLFGSFGMARVLFAILPLTAIICLDGFNLVTGILRSINIYLYKAAAVAIVAWIIIFPFSGNYFAYHFPDDFRGNEESQMINSAVAWLQTQPQLNGDVFFSDPYAAIALPSKISAFDKDHYDFKMFTDPKILAPGSIYIWDDWFSVVERNSPLDTLLASNRFTLCKCFENEQGNPHPKICVLKKN